MESLLSFLDSLSKIARDYVSSAQESFSSEDDCTVPNQTDTETADVPCIIPPNKSLKEGVECCGNVFYYPSTLKQHLSTLLHQKSQKCHLCGERFNCRKDLSDHEKSVHSKFGKVFVCKICKTIVGGRNQLDRHTRNVHNDDRPFKCSLCSFSSKTKYTVDRHIKRRHIKKPKEFLCTVCGLFFENTSALSGHIKVIHDRNRVQCLVCYRSFKDKVELDIHKKCHLPGKNFLCQVCGKAFKRMKQRELHHKIHTKPLKEKKAKLLCQVCGKDFKTFTQREKHFLTHTKKLKKRRSVNHSVSLASSKNESVEVNSSGIYRNKQVTLSMNQPCRPILEVSHEDAKSITPGFDKVNDEFAYVDVEALDDDDSQNDLGSVYILPDCIGLGESDVGCQSKTFDVVDSCSIIHDNSVSNVNCLLQPDLKSPEKAQLEVKANVTNNIVARCSSPCNSSEMNQLDSAHSRSVLATTHDSVVMVPSVEDRESGTSSSVFRLADPVESSEMSHVNYSETVNKEINSPLTSNAKKGCIKLPVKKKQVGLKRRVPHKLREITLQESNVPKKMRCVQRLSADSAPQSGHNSSRKQKASGPRNSIIFEQNPELVESESTIVLLKESPACCANHLPHDFFEGKDCPSVNYSSPQLLNNGKCKEKTVTRTRKAVNKKSSSIPEVPRVYVTNVCDESDVFLLPEFFTEDDVENWMPSQEITSSILMNEELPVLFSSDDPSASSVATSVSHPSNNEGKFSELSS